MSKNLTRKGLAISAVVALGTSLFAGAPAQAAGLSVVANTGTGFTVLASDTFTLKVLGATSSDDLKWQITKPSSTQAVSYTQSDNGTNTPAAYSTTTVDYLSQPVSATAGQRPTLALNPTTSSTSAASVEFVVKAYIESGNTNGLDALDTVVSAPVTVKFVKNLVPTVAIDPVSVGEKVTGTVSYGADFNYAQSTLASTNVLIAIDGGAFGGAGSATREVTRNTAETGFEFAAANASSPTVAAGTVVAAKGRSVSYDSDTTYTYSTVVYSTASAASTATAQETEVTRSENIANNTTDSWYVRTGTKSFSYRVDFTKASGNQSVGAGQPVVLKLSESGSTIVSTDVLRINGKTMTAADAAGDTAVVNTTTDANGGVTVSIESVTGAVGDIIVVTATAPGTSGPVQSSQTFTWADAVITNFTEAAAPLGSTTRTVVKGSAVSIKYAIRDQFGKVWTKSGSSYQLRYTASQGTLVVSSTADFVDGIATASFTDNSTGADADTLITATVYTKTTGDYTQETGFTTDSVASTLNIVTAAQAAAKITLNDATLKNTTGTVVSLAAGTASTAVARSNVALSALDNRSNINILGLNVGSDKGAAVSGTVYNADGSASAGVAVTIAAAGLFFSTEASGANYVSADSITVNTNTSGQYTVYVFSKKGGTFTTTVTSGSVSKTQALKFAAADAADGKTLTITAPANVLPGRAVDVVVLLVDKYGAPVTTSTASPISISLTGVGYATTIAANTDADGKIAFKLVLGATEVGTATITAKYDADDSGSNFLPITTVATINVSNTLPATSAATAAVSGSTGKFFVSATNAAAKRVVVKVAGKFFRSFTGTAAKKTVALKAPKGKHKVTVFVGGKLVATKTITVK